MQVSLAGWAKWADCNMEMALKSISPPPQCMIRGGPSGHPRICRPFSSLHFSAFICLSIKDIFGWFVQSLNQGSPNPDPGPDVALRKPLPSPWQATGPLSASCPPDLAGKDYILQTVLWLYMKDALRSGSLHTTCLAFRMSPEGQKYTLLGFPKDLDLTF